MCNNNGCQIDAQSTDNTTAANNCTNTNNNNHNARHNHTLKTNLPQKSSSHTGKEGKAVKLCR